MRVRVPPSAPSICNNVRDLSISAVPGLNTGRIDVGSALLNKTDLLRAEKVRRFSDRNYKSLQLVQIDEPSRWIAIQATIWRPDFTGRTRQNMMKGVPSFL